MESEQPTACGTFEYIEPLSGGVLREVVEATSHSDVDFKPSQTDDYSGIWICRITGFKNEIPELEVTGIPTSVPAFAVACSLSLDDVGAIVAVTFDRESIWRPIILGKVRSGLESLSDASRHVEIVAENQMSLRCGKASITMKSDGTVAIRGTNLISRASHTNRIRGGNVQIN